MLTVITGFHPAGWRQYGERMVRTFDLRWPRGVDLAIFYDEAPPNVTSSKRRITWLSYHDVPRWLRFMGRWRPDPWAKGLTPTSAWRAKEREAGYAYRSDALKFARVPFAVEWYLREKCWTEYAFWLDGDTVYFRDVPPVEDLLASLMPGGCDVSYLGRPGSYPEIGFQGYRAPGACDFLERWAGLYEAEGFVGRAETHSALLFGEALGGNHVNLTPDGRKHVWMQSPLVEFSDHLKGDTRKRKGYSGEHPLKHEVQKA